MARDLLDLHGCRAEEIPDKVDKFLVDSQKAGLHRVRIMTGKGKGVVQKEVIAYLKMGKYPWNFETNARRLSAFVGTLHARRWQNPDSH